MQLEEKIQTCYRNSKNYPELAKALSGIGVQSYTVDVATGILLYRFPDGTHVIHAANNARHISEKFDLERTKQAIKANQKGETNYPQFMDDVAAAGVRFYEATLNGDRKRVTYLGLGGRYEELISQ